MSEIGDVQADSTRQPTGNAELLRAHHEVLQELRVGVERVNIEILTTKVRVIVSESEKPPSLKALNDKLKMIGGLPEDGEDVLGLPRVMQSPDFDTMHVLYVDEKTRMLELMTPYYFMECFQRFARNTEEDPSQPPENAPGFRRYLSGINQMRAFFVIKPDEEGPGGGGRAPREGRMEENKTKWRSWLLTEMPEKYGYFRTKNGKRFRLNAEPEQPFEIKELKNVWQDAQYAMFAADFASRHSQVFPAQDPNVQAKLKAMEAAVDVIAKCDSDLHRSEYDKDEYVKQRREIADKLLKTRDYPEELSFLHPAPEGTEELYTVGIIVPESVKKELEEFRANLEKIAMEGKPLSKRRCMALAEPLQKVITEWIKSSEVQIRKLGYQKVKFFHRAALSLVLMDELRSASERGGYRNIDIIFPEQDPDEGMRPQWLGLYYDPSVMQDIDVRPLGNGTERPTFKKE